MGLAASTLAGAPAVAVAVTNRWNRKHRRREISGEHLLPPRHDDLPLFQNAELHELADHLAQLHELTPEQIIDGALDEGDR